MKIFFGYLSKDMSKFHFRASFIYHFLENFLFLIIKVRFRTNTDISSHGYDRTLVLIPVEGIKYCHGQSKFCTRFKFCTELTLTLTRFLQESKQGNYYIKLSIKLVYLRKILYSCSCYLDIWVIFFCYFICTYSIWTT